uniref:Uncharacterized protein n=1 Tax=Arundo donax TaxID=35708 RepID=A0A0A9DZY7_ARUDO
MLEAGVCLPSHLHRSYHCWLCWNHLRNDSQQDALSQLTPTSCFLVEGSCKRRLKIIWIILHCFLFHDVVSPGKRKYTTKGVHVDMNLHDKLWDVYRSCK